MENKKNILDVVSISGLRVKKFEGERGYLSTGDLDFNKIANIELVSYENKPSRANQNVNVGEVIFAKMKDTKKTLIIDEENKDIIVSTGFYVLKPSEQILSKYLYHYLNSDYFLNQKNKLSKGATQCALNNEGLSNITIYMYNLETQKKIVEVLDKSQDLIDKRKVQIEILDLLVKSKFIEMFGDLKYNSKKWSILNFNDFAIIDTNMTKDFETYKEYPHIGIDSIEKNTGNILEYSLVKDCNLKSGKYIFDERHIIYSKIRPNLNKVALPNFKGLCSADSYPILCNKGIIERSYLGYVLRSEFFLNYILNFSGRTNIPKVNKEQLKGFNMPVPPIELQNQFAEFVKQVDKLKFEMEKSLKELEDNFNSLMQKSFKGKLFI